MAERPNRPGPRPRGHVPRRGAAPLVVAGRTLACTVSVAVLGASGFTWYEYRSLDDGMTKSTALSEAKKNAPPHLDKSVNLLLIGLDSRKDMDGNDLPKQFVEDELHAGSSEIGGYNTNALIVLHIPANGGKVTALSVPRDNYVQTVGADGKMHKIKEAYGIAKGAAERKLAGKGLSKADLERQSREAGRSATIQTVQSFLDVPIDHFAEVNLIGFYDIARAVEPIQVCLNHPVDDPIIARTATHEGGGTGLKLPAGISSLNAAQALSFVRQRHHLTNGDLDRTHRQQAFISSVEYRLKQQGVLNDFGQMQKLFGVVKKDVVIDNEWNILDFARQAPNLTGGNVEFNTLPIAGFKTVGGQEVNTVNAELIKKIVRQLFNREPAPVQAAPAPTEAATETATPSPPAASPTAARSVVDVNAVAGAGAAATESKALTELGYQPGRIGDATARTRATTVTYGSGARADAQQLATRYGVTPTATAGVAPGHILVTLAATRTPSPTATPSPPAAAATDPVAGLPMQGPAVKAGGIPCVD
ncbi:LCP family protein required for cell wall assembly [Kitasatospora sp. MAA19]|uniref:LCP family protein n=1 Tax=Kitasatospora sp. MAA19 TaxID=3035090 RepID=UPI0024745154|nr:LCP family protein [Kitasatospora sp. MAA19]MDH6707487.1 LCP family protein required for cell wall assembly [Kitasatospora sp. MAA19]